LQTVHMCVFIFQGTWILAVYRIRVSSELRGWALQLQHECTSLVGRLKINDLIVIVVECAWLTYLLYIGTWRHMHIIF